MFTVLTEGPEETRAWGEKLAGQLFDGSVVALKGQLGGGKTVFVQGVARGLGIVDAVTSPTFLLVREYPRGRLPLYHVDAYRLDCALELEYLGLDEILGHEGVVIAEWAGKLVELLPRERMEVELEHVHPDYPQRRKLTFSAHGTGYQEILKELSAGVNPGP